MCETETREMGLKGAPSPLCWMDAREEETQSQEESDLHWSRITMGLSMTQGSQDMCIPERTLASLSSLMAFFVKHGSVSACLVLLSRSGWHKAVWALESSRGERPLRKTVPVLSTKGTMTKKKGCLLFWPEVLFGLQNRAISCSFLPRPTPDCQGEIVLC